MARVSTFSLGIVYINIIMLVNLLTACVPFFFLGNRPCLDIYRGPYAGRAWEAFGEDPYLQGVAGALTVKGIQSEGVVSIHVHIFAFDQ